MTSEEAPYKRAEAVSFGLDTTFAGDINMWLPDYEEEDDEEPDWLCEYETNPNNDSDDDNKKSSSSWFSLGELILDRRLSGFAISKQAKEAKEATDKKKVRGRAPGQNNVKRTRSRSVATLRLGKENEDMFGNKKRSQKNNNGLDGYLSKVTPLAALMEGGGGGGGATTGIGSGGEDDTTTRASITSGMSVLERREARLKKREANKQEGMDSSRRGGGTNRSHRQASLDSSSRRGGTRQEGMDSSSRRGGGNRSRRGVRSVPRKPSEPEPEEEKPRRRHKSGSPSSGRRKAATEEEEEEKPDYDWAKGSMSSSTHSVSHCDPRINPKKQSAAYAMMSASAPGRFLARTRSKSMTMMTSVGLSLIASSVNHVRDDRDNSQSLRSSTHSEGQGRRRKPAARGRTIKEELEEGGSSKHTKSPKRDKNRGKSPRNSKKKTNKLNNGAATRKGRFEDGNGSSIKGSNKSKGNNNSNNNSVVDNNKDRTTKKPPSASLISASASFAKAASMAANLASTSVTLVPMVENAPGGDIDDEMAMQQKLDEIVAAAEAATAALAKAQQLAESFHSLMEQQQDVTESTWDSSDESSEFLPEMKPFHRTSSI